MKTSTILFLLIGIIILVVMVYFEVREHRKDKRIWAVLEHLENEARKATTKERIRTITFRLIAISLMVPERAHQLKIRYLAEYMQGKLDIINM
jgi:hypothetical protein